ncbi:MAG TPA: GFA family protein [Pseudomonadales bacterium]|nr:GFA family protein [Pseudomonadales bacterium]
MSLTGRCLCGAIHYEIANPPTTTGVCHCRNCQRQGGSAFSTLAAVPTSEFTLTGTPKLYADSDTDSGNTVQRFFCGDCGSPIYSAIPAMPDQIFLKTGTLDDTSDFRPMFHVWCSTKQNWVALEDGVPTMAKT